ncbi:MAG: nucleotidyltransferase domain-containing protein [Aquificaceae bacterium]|uniref:nucleotidyltransferase domain-containing protein n=1 Tax=Hydrogenobacter sp. Uz 6-8 TaxID=3384828 RepID=UPI00309E7260
MERAQILSLIGIAIEEVLQKDCLVVFYGSVLSERFSRSSDVDVGIFCKDQIEGKEYMRLLSRLEELPLLRDVELIDLWRVKSAEFLDKIIQEGYFWKSSKELMTLLRRRLEDLKKRACSVSSYT